MRIGQVSTKYKISIDNLYYYINYGLLVPKRPKSQYIFDEQTLKDLELVLELKEMGFSLKDIHIVLSLYRISGLADPQDIEDLKAIYTDKLHHCKKDMKQLEDTIASLERKLSDLNAMLPSKEPQIGLPVNMLHLLCCPNCRNGFQMDQVHMDAKYVFNGNLSCSCGYEAIIKDGVLLTPNKNKNKQDTPDLDRKLYKDLPPALISLFQRSYNWMVEKLDHMVLQGKVIMETYINAWFFMHNHQQFLDSGGQYIVVDKYPEMLYMYKKLMEQQGYNLDILFIADSSTSLPLRPGCVDLNIDYFAVNEHNFYHDSFLYDELRPYFSHDCQLLGTYFYFKDGHKSMETLLKEYPECTANNFSISYFLNAMKPYITEYEDCGFTTSSGANIGFSFHQEGEKMYLHCYLANADNG